MNLTEYINIRPGDMVINRKEQLEKGYTPARRIKDIYFSEVEGIPEYVARLDKPDGRIVGIILGYARKGFRSGPDTLVKTKDGEEQYGTD